MITLEKDERIILTARKHWFVLLAETFFLFFLILIPFALLVLGEKFQIFSTVSIPGNGVHLFGALASGWFLVLWVTFFVVWTDYHLDILILTNTRVIDVEQHGLFSREVATIQLNRIQDVAVKVRGVIPTLLNFGDLHIQSAGHEREFIVKGVAYPGAVKEALLKEHIRPNSF